MKSNKTILIVEDDTSINFGLKEVFEGEGFTVLSCERGDEAEQLLGKEKPDLAILDVMLPGKNGFEICKSIRSTGNTLPILMLTSKGQELDKVIGLDAGADDYVTKPFGVRELVARVNALLRRVEAGSSAASGADAPTEVVRVGEASVDPKTFGVSRDGADEVNLTAKEMELLLFLAHHRGEVMSRERILDEVWGVNYYGTTRTLDQCVAQLRKKLGDNGSKPAHLVTVHGVGYKLVAASVSE